MNTKDRILDKALELMNLTGNDTVSTHEIAKNLGIRQSNITYYFPSRTEMLSALFKRMVEEVNQPVKSIEPAYFSFSTFYDSLDRIMQVHERYRFLLMNYGTLITTNPELNEYLIRVLETRYQEFEGVLTLLSNNGFIIGNNLFSQREPVLHMLNMIIVYWVQEAAIYHQEKTDAEKRKHFLSLFFQIFIPYLTKKGREDLMPLLN
jgi:AcrR family transcriptional regulator